MASLKKADCTPEQWAAFLQSRRDARKAKSAKPATVAAIDGEPNTLEIDVEDLAPAPQGTFRERMAAKIKGAVGLDDAKPASKAKGKKVEVNFLTKALPLLSGIMASYASTWFDEPYKACAPKREEVVAVFSPILSMIERRIEITGKMSQDSLDLMASGTAMLGLVGRSYVTYVDIKQEKGKSNGNEKSASSSVESASPYAEPDDDKREAALIRSFGRSTVEGAVSGDSSNLVRQSPGYLNELSALNDAEISGGAVFADDGEDKSRQLAVVAQAFKRDAYYRTANGLL